VSSWREVIDDKPGRAPVIRATAHTVTYEVAILGGLLADGLFTPAPRMRLLIRCDDQERVFLAIRVDRTTR